MRTNHKDQSQAQQIFEYLYGTANTITGLQALKLFGTIKCSNRISEIERDYHVTVNRKPIKIKTRFGDKRVMQYSIPSSKQNASA